MTRTFRQIIAAGVLLAYSLGGTSLGTGLFAILAAWNGAHQVNVRTLESGGIEIVLHHQKGNYTPLVEDHNSTMARLLASLCSADSLGDHVLAQQVTKACVTTQRGGHEIGAEAKQKVPTMKLSAATTLIFPWCLPQRAERDPEIGWMPTGPAHDGGCKSGWPHAQERTAALLI